MFIDSGTELGKLASIAVGTLTWTIHGLRLSRFSNPT
jgi:hypothetical protein